MNVQVSPLPVNEEQKEKIVAYFSREIEDAISARSEMEKQWKQAIRQYYGRLERKAAGKRRANIDIPITREYSQQSKARLVNPLFQQQESLFVCWPRPNAQGQIVPGAEQFARELEEALDYISDKAGLLKVCNDWVRLSHIYHYVPIKAAWTDEKRTIKEWQKQQVPVMDEMGQPAMQIMQGMDGMPVMQPVMQEQMVEVEREVQTKLGCYPRVLPAGDLVLPSDTYDVESARWVAHQFYLTKLEVKQRIRAKDYEGEIQKVTADSTDRPDYLVETKRLMGLDISKQKGAKHYEVYTTIGEIREAMECKEGEHQELGADNAEVILTIDKDNSQYRRGIYNFFHAYPRPFVLWSYEESENSPFGVSLAYILEPMHKAYSAMVCQELDAQSSANKTLLVVPAGSDVAKQFKDGEMPEGVVELNADTAQIKQFNLSQPRTTSPEMRRELQSHCERVSAVAAINFGQDPQQRPTATGQNIQSTESQQPLYDKMESFRGALSKLALMMLARYKQFYPAGLEYYLQVPSEDGMTMTPGFVQWQDGAIEEQVYVETRTSSSTMNKQMQKQEKLAMLDKAQAFLMPIAQMASQAVMPSPMAPVMMKLLAGYQTLFDDMLTTFEIADKNKINPDLSQELNLGAMVQSLVQQNQELLAALQGGPPPGSNGPGPPSGSPPGGPGMGAPPGMAGPQQGPPPGGANGGPPPGPG